ncbi:hypothetical protein B1H58_19320 [Pantoea alhagi]|uniref:HTH tetR-type domain-containing protein n=1 Tax=Pantoea alhagi TaxID=1891675 RepID=A0A1W6BA38_9GAMM|nr:TetR/AcrR family transcriptional regulator [Pantoea alhagi]ARJ43986.1 hypothetical protein B1H58_19320 [Pantoea alhagi]
MAISSAAQKVSDAAVTHFAERGFESASLKEIAEAAGIRKATIYSHFKNKDELFLHAFSGSIEVEGAFVSSCFDADTEAGERYLARVASRYSTSEHLRLMLRTAFIPPGGLREQVSLGYEKFISHIRARFVAKLQQNSSDAELLAEAYIGIIDSVHVELLYASPAAAERRRKALWHILHAAVTATHR